MEAVIQSNIKIPNSLIVTGLTGTYVDEELFDFLKRYGSFQIVPIESTKPEVEKKTFVEYTTGASVQALSPLLPYRFSPKTRPDITYLVEALSSVYSPVVSKTATQTYLTELRDIAKLTGKDFTDVLREELYSITKAVDTDEHDNPHYYEDSDKAPDSHTPLTRLPETPQAGDSNHHFTQAPVGSFPQNPTLKASDLNPPEFQKVIVEHILRADEIHSQMNTSFRLRHFSGRCPHPNSEVDFETWRSSVELFLKDTNKPDSNKSRRLLESLSSPAVDLVKHLPADSPPAAYLQILDSAFGTVEDGDDLFAKYLNTMQNHGEEPSSYLQRLQVMLNTTLIRGGISAQELDKQLLKQFIRGCWDNELIAELQLEQKKQTPPTFADLLLMLRTAEERRTSKMSRMKQHLNTTKPKVFSRYQSVDSQSPERFKSQATDPLSEIQDLKKQIASLQSHLASLKDKKHHKTSQNRSRVQSSPKGFSDNFRSRKPQTADPRMNDTPNRPKPWYCFRCGEDGHIKPQCENEPNSPLVSLKRKQLKDKQMAWDKVNSQEYEPLN